MTTPRPPPSDFARWFQFFGLIGAVFVLGLAILVVPGYRQAAQEAEQRAQERAAASAQREQERLARKAAEEEQVRRWKAEPWLDGAANCRLVADLGFEVEGWHYFAIAKLSSCAAHKTWANKDGSETRAGMSVIGAGETDEPISIEFTSIMSNKQHLDEAADAMARAMSLWFRAMDPGESDAYVEFMKHPEKMPDVTASKTKRGDETRSRRFKVGEITFKREIIGEPDSFTDNYKFTIKLKGHP